MHLPFFTFTAVQSVTGLTIDPPGIQWGPLPFVVAVGALQIRHSLAIAEGNRPRYWEWTLVSLLLLTYLPFPVFLHRWSTAHWYLIASLLMLLPERLAIAAAVTDAVALSAWYATSFGLGPAQIAWHFAYAALILLSGGGSLYAAARLVWHAQELRGTRAELAELAIERERLRISRDLHDLLGHSLSAVALKGDLAQRLLERQQVSRAEAEIASLVSVARSALSDLRDITHR